jgi:hypothetical protein
MLPGLPVGGQMRKSGCVIGRTAAEIDLLSPLKRLPPPDIGGGVFNALKRQNASAAHGPHGPDGFPVPLAQTGTACTRALSSRTQPNFFVAIGTPSKTT